MAQVLDTLYVDIVTRNFQQVNQQIRGVTDQLRQAATGAQVFNRSAGGSFAGMGSSALAARGAVAGLAVAGVALGVALVAVGAGLALVKRGFADTVELYRFQSAMTAISREAAGLFVPVMNQATRSAWSLLDTFRNSPHLQDAISVGLVAPMVLFVKGLEVAIKLSLVLGETLTKVAGAFLKALDINLGDMGIFGRLVDAVRKANKQVTLNQTGEESGQQSFQRIQQAILKLQQPDENDPVVEVLKEIDKKAEVIANAIRGAGAAVEQDAKKLVGEHVGGPAMDALGFGAFMLGLPDRLLNRLRQ